MILDSLQNAALYSSIHPRFQQAFDFLCNTDLSALPLGKIELDGSKLVVNVVEIAGKSATEAKMETHNQYIDIQIPLSVTETMGWIAADKLAAPTEPYSADKDIAFYADKATNFIVVKPLDFVVFFPTDGHQPGLTEGLIRKVIVKVLV